MAVEVSQRVLDMVRRELVQNPDVDNAVLYDKALELDPTAMKDVDRRQFNARYPLRVKRFELQSRKPKEPRVAKPRRPKKTEKEAAPSIAPARRSAAPASTVRKAARDSVRNVLLRFAQDLANAESRGDIVGVVANVDQYVEQILEFGSSPE